MFIKLKKRWAGLIFIFLLLVLVLSFLFFTDIARRVRRSYFVVKLLGPSQVWVNVFVHGTVSSALSFLDLPAAKSDQVKGSIYKKAASLIRKNEIFYRDQAMLDKGLLRIEPSFQQEVDHAAISIAKGFDLVNRVVNNFQSEQMYYTFGWTGLISQYYRRRDSLRLYNALNEEVARLKKLGFDPKVRIIAHSHGNNVALNMGGLSSLFDGEIKRKSFYKKYDLGSQVSSSFQSLLSKIPNLNEAVKKTGSKRFTYLPQAPEFDVDELVMLAGPIQEETSLFMRLPFFKKIVNIYSVEDLVQDADMISTSKPSLKRYNFIEKELEDKFFQARVVIEESGKSLVKQRGSGEYQALAWWQIVFGLKSIERKSLDPTHKEFWFIVDASNQKSFILPIPIVVFVPAITKVIPNLQKQFDYDIRLIFDNGNFLIDSYERNGENPVQSIRITDDIFAILKSQFKQRLKYLKGSSEISRLMEQAVRQVRTNY